MAEAKLTVTLYERAKNGIELAGLLVRLRRGHVSIHVNNFYGTWGMSYSGLYSPCTKNVYTVQFQTSPLYSWYSLLCCLHHLPFYRLFPAVIDDRLERAGYDRAVDLPATRADKFENPRGSNSNKKHSPHVSSAALILLL